MTIPTHLVPLLCQLAHEHFVRQVHQVRLMGHDHPQARAAREHLDRARELRDAVCGPERVAA